MIPEGLIVSHGMDVVSSDGEKIGTVTHVWPTVEDTSSGISTTGVFQVDQGGILGLGAKHLYVPYIAVRECVPGERVTLKCAKVECADRYGDQPAFLQEGA
jgi:hypothetical protein